MPRPPRLILPTVPVHVIQRGHNRATTFESPAEFKRYRTVLFEESARRGCAIHAYVLMTNHVHLLLTPESVHGVSSMMQAIGRRYVRWVNERRHRTGTLWEGRFKSSVIDSDRYLMTCSRYIELNPVRAGMVSAPGQYQWSSYRHNAHGAPDDGLTPHALYNSLGADAAERQMGYRGLFRHAPKPALIDDIRRGIKSGGVVGRDVFRARVQATVARPITRMKHGGDRRSPGFQSGSGLAHAFQ